MRVSLLIAGVAAGAPPGTVEAWLQTAFYPALLGILVIASLGVPIPEDFPLIAAGFIMRTNPETASWFGTIGVALVGIMTGDTVLYGLGRRWGRGVIGHRSVNWLITPTLYERAAASFQKRGVWYCFFGRFFMGIRAVMCMTAGATHFPFWKFWLADFAGALLSVPFFVAVGYIFAGLVPIEALGKHVAEIQGWVIGVILAAVAIYVAFEVRKHRRMRRESERAVHPEQNPPLGADAADERHAGRPGQPERHAVTDSV